MKRLFQILLSTVLAVSVASCGHKKAETATVAEDNEPIATEQTIKERIEELYMIRLSAPDSIPVDSLLSAELIRQQQFADSISEAEGLILGWEFDPWTLSQDPDDPQVEVKNCVFDDKSHVTANVGITDFGETKELTLKLVLENGKWMVDDFIYMNGTIENSLKDDLHYDISGN